MDILPTTPDSSLTRRFLKGMLVGRSLLVLVVAVITAIAHSVFNQDLELLPIALILGFLGVTSLLRARALGQVQLPGERQVFLQMVVDIMALTGLFYFFGGATNPFVWFFLIPAILAAMVLSPAHARAISALCIICYSSLLFFFQPTHQHGAVQPDPGFALHVVGMWMGFILSAGFVAFTVSGLAERLRNRERILAEAREQVLRNEHLAALGTIAAGAAHDLGTPLGTMAILSTDLQDDPVIKQHPELGQKLELMRDQVERCKQTLSLFSSNAGAARAESGKAMSVRGYLTEMLGQWQKLNPATPLEVRLTGKVESAWLFVETTLTPALHNLLDNAGQASPAGILVKSGWSKELLTIKIIDKGPGIAREVLETLGQKPVWSNKGGMGVGLYLAVSSIRRLGGTLNLANLPEGGVMAKVTLPVFTSDKGGQ
jgi:two-component system sensor histidine kinase RegB